MTRITLTLTHGGTQRWLRINGRLQPTDRVAELHRTAPGEWRGALVSGIRFTVFGGRSAGGARRDWFLRLGDSASPIYCTSAADAFRVLVNA